METDDEFDEPTPEYHNEPRVCRHGFPAGSGCEWCEEDKENLAN